MRRLRNSGLTPPAVEGSEGIERRGQENSARRGFSGKARRQHAAGIGGLVVRSFGRGWRNGVLRPGTGRGPERIRIWVRGRAFLHDHFWERGAGDEINLIRGRGSSSRGFSGRARKVTRGWHWRFGGSVVRTRLAGVSAATGDRSRSGTDSDSGTGSSISARLFFGARGWGRNKLDQGTVLVPSR